MSISPSLNEIAKLDEKRARDKEREQRQEFKVPDGFCAKCGGPWWTVPHDHKPIGTLSAADALALWEEYAAESR
jgi:hypothetical protein